MSELSASLGEMDVSSTDSSAIFEESVTVLNTHKRKEEFTEVSWITPKKTKGTHKESENYLPSSEETKNSPKERWPHLKITPNLKENLAYVSAKKKDETRYHLVYECKLWTDYRRKGFPKDFAVMTLKQLLHRKDFRKAITEILKKRLEMALEER
ncbi:hypothetical protein CEXT_9121 [Caerostris extrusa]|uniref:Uncharacterized protein n=1 Tax=Caerostris extrusa TaxID=172846 RepID=A0AAV4XIL7_CAEEX|nr:hypothetical protein CEXT_9121 [Caerostris extrusa]